MQDDTAGLSTKLYRAAWLRELADDRSLLDGDRPMAERLPVRPAAVLDVPPLMFCNSDFSDRNIQQSFQIGTGGARQPCPEVVAYLLRNAVVHRKLGVVTVADHVARDTLNHLPAHAVPGNCWEDEEWLRLSQYPRAATLPSAYHLLACKGLRRNNRIKATLRTQQ